MTRTTQTQLSNLAAYLARACGHNFATTYAREEGTWYLDNNPIYGGYVMCERIGTSAEHHPFGDQRRPPREMWAAMHMALRAVEIANPVIAT